MSWFSLALLGITALTVVTPFRITNYRQKHIPPADVLSFQRGSVEQPPELFRKINDQSEFGSKQLPLRTAVEAPPDIIGSKSLPLRAAVESIPPEQVRKIPLRDAVEHRVAPFFGGLDHDSIWIERLTPPFLRNTRSLSNVICHLEARAAYRPEPFALLPQSVPDRKCSHLIYNAATVDPHEFTLISQDPEYDEIKGGYKAAVGLKQRDPALRVLISITSPDSGRLFEELVHGSECCQNFVQSILNFLELHNFDGVEIDWEAASTAEMRMLLRELYEPMKERDFMVVVAIRPNDPVDPEIAEMSDLLIFRSWRNYRSNIASHPAPINFIQAMVNKWINSGVDSDKIILGIPLFGNSYTLKLRNSTEVGAPIAGSGLPGRYTGLRGVLAYYEICEKIEDGWLYGRDEEGSYVKYGDQWVGYDDPISVKLKMAYIQSKNLGGVSLWALDLDDFQGLCGESWPILTAVTKALGLYDINVRKCYEEGLFSDPNDCSGFTSCANGELYHGTCGFGRFFDAVTGLCVKASPQICIPGQSLRISQPDLEFERLRDAENVESLDLQQGSSRVVCYITSWALYRKAEGKFVPEHLDPRLCTDVVYAFAGLNPDSLLVQPFDPWADIENNLYQRVTSIKGPKVLLAIGGWTDSSGDKYSRLVNSGGSRRKFVAAAISFLRRYNFDGLSLEWNYPRCWQSDCNKGPESDKPNFTKLLKELRDEFDKQVPKLTLAVGISGYKEVIDRAYEVEQISDLVDFMSVMTYDYHGAWETKTGHLAPLYRQPGDNYVHYNVNYTMEYLANLGAARSKLLLGIPFYGQAYRLADASHSELGDAAAGPGVSGEFTRQPGMLAYYEICHRLQKQRWQAGEGSIAHYKDQWVGYDDINNVKKKGEYILENGYGGAVAWTVDLDDFTNRCCLEPFPLLRSLNRALGRLVTPPPSDGSCEKPVEPVTPAAPTLTTHSDANDGRPQPTRPIETTTRKATTWPTWTQGTTKKPQVTTPSSTAAWPVWVQTTTKKPEIPIETTTQEPLTTTTTTTTTTTLRPSTVFSDPIEQSPSPGVSAPLPGSECEPGQYLPDSTNCANYFRCVLGELKSEQCAPGLHWHAQQSRCDWPSTAKCQSDKTPATTTVKPWYPTRRPTRVTTLSTTTDWRHESKEPISQPTTTRRPATTTERVTTTSQKPETTTLKPIESLPTELPEAIEHCEHGQYYPEPGSCTHFLICVNGVLITQQCGPGLSWSVDKKMCDWAYKNPCKSINRKNAALTKDTDENACTSGSYTAVPGDCESYQACLWGRPEIFQCAPGLHFNKLTHNCDWPARANCSSEVNSPAIVPTKIPGAPFKPTSKPIRTTTSEPLWTQITTPSTTPLSPAAIDPEKVSPLSGHYKVVCYFTNWAWYRRGAGRYLPEHIDHTLCTHIVYGFAVLDYSNLVIKAHDSWADFDNRFYERVVAYKQRGLKVLLALGGWNDSAGDKYSRLVNNPASRKKFITHALQFLEKYGFDGLDLDWEYPVCWQVECNKGPASDKQGFSSLLEELSSELKPRELLLTAAVSPNKRVIDAGYDVPVLAKYLDWIAVMTYDFHGQWDKKTGHASPLYYHPDDDLYFFNANYSINYWISKGAPSRNIVMGMPLYGQSFTINDPKAGVGLNVPASAGNAGEFTKAAGFLSYYEICDRIHNRGWTVVQDPQRRMGPYAYKGSQWVSFDDADMLRQKAQFVRDMNLGGGMVWALDLDDFRGRCGEGAHPLMHTLQQVLADPPNQHDRPIKPPAFGEELQWKIPEDNTLDAKPSSSAVAVEPNPNSNPKIDDEFKVVCYFTNWAWYRQEGGKFLPENIDPELCSHIIYGFAVLDTTSLTIKPHDSWADLDNKFYERVVAFRSRGVKVLLAIGGWNDSAGDKYSRLANSAAARRRFVTHVIQFIVKYGFDGLDLDWEYPVCWQVDCGKGPASDKEGFSLLLKELSAQFRPKNLLLSSAVSPNKRVIDAGYDVPVIAEYLDWIAVMTYDYHGQWDKKTGHNAPLYERPDDWEPTFNANFSIHYWMEKGAPAKKLVMGAPLYGQSFSLAESKERGLNVPTYGGGEAGEATRARGFLSYYEICARSQQRGWTIVQDPLRRIGPYAYKGDQWVSFDDAKQIKLKAEFIKRLGLGGGMVWALDLDDFKNDCGCEPFPLLRTMNRVLRNYPDGPTCLIADLIESEAPSTVTPSPTPLSPKPDYMPSKPTKPPTTTTATTSRPISTTEPDIDDSIEVDVGLPLADIPPIGDCQGQMYIPHKKDCSKYFLCNFGQLTEQKCPGGLYWNKDRCDWPENTKCKNLEEISVIDSNIPGESDEPAIITTTTLRPVILTEKPPYKPEVPIISENPNLGNKKLVCYFTNWAWYRPGVGKYVPDDIDTNLCTHIVYGFAVLDTEGLTIKTHDSWADIDNEFYRKVTSLKEKGIKVLIALGGWNDSEGDKYSRLVNNAGARRKFIAHVLQFIDKHDFDGLDLDWEYPVCWQVDCNRGPSSDKQGFASLLRELSAEFKPKGLLLSSAVSPSKRVIDFGYDVPALAKYLDWIAVMTYDFHGHWERKTGHVAPLYYYPGDEFDYFNANFSMNYWIEKGAPPSSLVMGVPLYGQSFTLSSVSNRGLQAAASGPGRAGEFTRAAGFLAFYEICHQVKNGHWTVVKDSEGRVGSYTTSGDQWVGYDDISDVTRKANLIRDLGLGGGMVWALDLDDFTNRCGCGKYPLLTALNRGLQGQQSNEANDCI